MESWNRKEQHMKLFICYLIVMNLITFFLYGLDKWKAMHHRWRISEAALLLAALIGGSIGALAGMYGFRHKTKHKKFTIGVPLLLILQIILLLWLRRPVFGIESAAAILF